MSKIAKISAFFIALMAMVSFSQENRTKLGIRAGFSAYYYTDDSIEDIDLNLNIGPGGGLAVNIPISDMLSVQPEIAFYWLSFYHGQWGPGSVELESSFSEIAVTIPIMLHIAPIEGIPFWVGAGVQLDHPLSQKMTIKFKVDDVSASISKDVDFKNTIDFGIPIGLGYNITQHFAIDLRYVIGLTGYGKEKNSNIDGILSQFQILQGYEKEKDNESFFYESEDNSFWMLGLGLTFFF